MSSIMTGRLRRKRRWTRIEKFHTSSTPQISQVEPKVEPKPAVDASVLELSIVKLSKALQGGSYDSHIEQLLELEAANKARKGAIAALKERLP